MVATIVKSTLFGLVLGAACALAASPAAPAGRSDASWSRAPLRAMTTLPPPALHAPASKLGN
jgi:hypothetical protein